MKKTTAETARLQMYTLATNEDDEPTQVDTLCIINTWSRINKASFLAYARALLPAHSLTHCVSVCLCLFSNEMA